MSEIFFNFNDNGGSDLTASVLKSSEETPRCSQKHLMSHIFCSHLDKRLVKDEIGAQ